MIEDGKAPCTEESQFNNLIIKTKDYFDAESK